MPKTIDYPRTSYLSAWEVAEVVDDFGGKCSVEACAKKLSRKVSGSFKAILGSAVKFGLLVSKREILTTTNLFRRIKHAYDKTEEKIYHREAFLHPPLFSHICRKFRNRELPVHMFDVMLVREFDVEEINAQSVAKAFVEGARMMDLINERNIIADIDQLTKAAPRRELASPEMGVNLFRPEQKLPASESGDVQPTESIEMAGPVAPVAQPKFSDDAVASLFGFSGTPAPTELYTPAAPVSAADVPMRPLNTAPVATPAEHIPAPTSSNPFGASVVPAQETSHRPVAHNSGALYTIRISGPGVDTQLSVQDDSDLTIVQALLDKIRKHLQQGT